VKDTSSCVTAGAAERFGRSCARDGLTEPRACLLQSVLANDAKVKKAWEGARPGMAARQAAQYKSRPNHAQLQRRLTSHHARYGNK